MEKLVAQKESLKSCGDWRGAAAAAEEIAHKYAAKGRKTDEYGEYKDLVRIYQGTGETLKQARAMR